MKKLILAAVIMLAVGSTTMAQTPAKKDTTSTTQAKKTHVKKHATKTTPAKTPAAKPQK